MTDFRIYVSSGLGLVPPRSKAPTSRRIPQRFAWSSPAPDDSLSTSSYSARVFGARPAPVAADLVRIIASVLSPAPGTLRPAARRDVARSGARPVPGRSGWDRTRRLE